MRRARRGFFALEVGVVVGLLAVVLAAIGSAQAAAHRRTRAGGDLADWNQAWLTVTGVLDDDLDHLVTRPGFSPWRVGPGGCSMDFERVKPPAAGGIARLATRRVTYAARPVRGGLLILRDGRPLVPVPFARVAFEQVRAGHTHQLRAVFTPVGGSAGAHVVEREPVLVARAVPVPASFPGLGTFLEQAPLDGEGAGTFPAPPGGARARSPASLEAEGGTYSGVYGARRGNTGAGSSAPPT